MAEKNLADEIIAIVKAESTNYPAPQPCTIINAYSDNKHADVKTRNGVLNYVPCIGKPVANDDAVVLFYESLDEYVIITGSSDNGGSTGVVMVGSFEINENGHLIATIPDGTANPYSINENGHLIYDTAATNGG